MTTARPTRRDRQQDARAKAAAFRESERRRGRRRLVAVLAVAVALVLVLAGVVVFAVVSSTTTAPAAVMGPEGMLLESGSPLAADTTSTKGTTEDGVQCGSSEQTATHIHSHLAVYVDGVLRPIPPGIGVVKPVEEQAPNGTPFYTASTCFYWLHVHAQDGVIHVEAPAGMTFTLGQFFAVWRQPLGSSQVAGARGAVTAYVDGRRVTGDPGSIVLRSREDVQLDVGKAVPFAKVDWSRSEL